RASCEPAATARTRAASVPEPGSAPVNGYAEWPSAGFRPPVGPGPTGSPGPGGMTGGREQRPLGQMRFEAGHATGPDDRVVRGPGHELEAVALREFHPTGVEAETDAAGLDHDHLVVAVVV